MARERKHLIAEIMIIIKLISNFESSAKQIYIMGTISSNKVGQQPETELQFNLKTET